MQVGGDVFAHGGVRAAAGFDGLDACGGQGGVLAEEVGVFAGGEVWWLAEGWWKGGRRGEMAVGKRGKGKGERWIGKGEDEPRKDIVGDSGDAVFVP